jgi:membrane-associated phospholipid phosphatase
MTSDYFLAVIVGMLAGGCLGYLATWRFARKLEAHEVVLAEWDRPYDLQAPREAGKVIGKIG